MQQSLEGKIALVTGSAHRVGKAIALALAAEGVNVVVHYHGSSDDTAQETARDIKSLGVDSIAVQADQADPAQVEALFARVQERFGRLDILVNSANMYRSGNFLDISFEDWQRVMNVNLNGVFLTSQAAARMMLAYTPPGGTIINIIDNSAITPWPRNPHHSVAKAGVLMLSKVMALALAPHIRVNAIAPGPVLREDRRSETSWDKLGQRLPLQRTGDAEDVGRAVVYLAREDWLTGTVIHVDGGENLTDSGYTLAQITTQD